MSSQPSEAVGYQRIVINAVVLAVLSFVMFIPAVISAGALNSAPPFVGLKLASDSLGPDACLRFDQATFLWSITNHLDCTGPSVLNGTFKVSLDDRDTFILTGPGVPTAKYKYEYNAEKGRVTFTPSLESNDARKVRLSKSVSSLL